MTNPVRDLCSRHGYPDELGEALEEVVAGVRDAYPGLVSLVLSGSTSTGDFAWRRKGQGVELLSDIEAFLYVDFRGAKPKRLAERISALKAKHPSPLFQIDIATNSGKVLKRIPPGYQMAETRRAGVILAGEDVLGAYPEEFDPRISRQLFLGNLWKPVLYWTPPGGSLDLVYTEVAARLFLDVALLACSEEGLCLPGHGQRVERFLGSPVDGRFHTPGNREAVSWALEVRRDPRPARAGLEERLASFARRVTAALDGQGEPPRDPDRALVRRLTVWLPPRRPRRLAGELRSLLRAPRGPLRDVAWLACRKEAVAGAALLGLLANLASGLDEPPAAGIAARLAEFSREPRIRSRGIDFLYDAKNAYWRGLRSLYPSLEAKAEAYAPFLKQPARD